MEYIIPITALILIFGPKLFKEVKDYLLQKEQIKANTELRAEALRLKNSLELEKFLENSNYEPIKNPNIDAAIDNSSFDTIKRKRDTKYE